MVSYYCYIDHTMSIRVLRFLTGENWGLRFFTSQIAELVLQKAIAVVNYWTNFELILEVFSAPKAAPSKP